MKTKLIRSLFLGLAAVALVSCQAPSSTPTSAVSCNKCGTVYFKSPASSSAPGGKGFVTLRPASSMDCADCENKVVAWLKTGSLTRHTCKTCGGTLNHCTQH
ncbi:hypothetical protein [Prosthecobacter sp.]|uniref:hypothetical protein n=1 Tax=Prosthecobacter sp. TaxID=1965333 RepID=UPI002ABB6116|nr:hypothetical protein [Prosthecobacter sp.]MDZ4405551.1 hypothetical protein [Prosthecobacter sp.]